MKRSIAVASCLLAALLAAGCASSETTGRQDVTKQGEILPKPDRIYVYNIRATPDEVPSDAAISGNYAQRQKPLTSEEIALGRKLGALVAKHLAEALRSMGLPAQHVTANAPALQDRDLQIKGEFLEIDEGSRTKRVLIGFGAGANQLLTHIEVFQMTDGRLRSLGGAQIQAEGGKMEGATTDLALAAATGGSLLTTTLISGGIKATSESGSESLEGAAKRTAAQIAQELSKDLVKHGWIPADKAM